MTQPYWTHDTFLFEAVFPTMDDKPIIVRGKVHQSQETYTEEYAQRSLLPLHSVAGKRIATHVAPYVQSFAPSPNANPNRPQGCEAVALEKRTTPKQPEQDIGKATGYYYPQERLLVVWECSFFSSWVPKPQTLSEAPQMEALWLAFEQLLMACFPDATRIATLGHDPDWEDSDFQAFLHRLGYNPSTSICFEKGTLPAPEK